MTYSRIQINQRLFYTLTREVERRTNEQSKVDNPLVPNNRSSNPLISVAILSIVSSRCRKTRSRVFQKRSFVESNGGSCSSREREGRRIVECEGFDCGTKERVKFERRRRGERGKVDVQDDVCGPESTGPNSHLTNSLRFDLENTFTREII